MCILIIAGQLQLTTGKAWAQQDTVSRDSTAVAVNLSVSLVSSYVWRGQLFDTHPQVQPELTIGLGSLEAGLWVSKSIGDIYTELDLFASVEIGQVKLEVYDYFYIEQKTMQLSDYWRYQNTPTTDATHTFDAVLTLSDPGIDGLSITASCFFAGYDHDESRKRLYSNYIGLEYTGSFNETEFLIALGGTLSEGFYATRPAFTQLAFTAIKSVDINPQRSLSLTGTLMVNPDSGGVYFIFGFSI